MKRLATIALMMIMAMVPVVARAHWEARPASPTAVQEVGFTELDRKLYLAGGIVASLPSFTALHQRFDTATGAWSTLAPLPVPEHHLHGEGIGGKVYYLGGLRGFPFVVSGKVWEYDPATDRFRIRRPMPPGRDRGAVGAAQLDGKIYVAGGQRENRATTLFDVYDPESDSWTALPDMPHAREHTGAAFVGDKLYVVGGRTSSLGGSEVAETDVYDVSDARWTSRLAPIPTPRGGLAVAAVNARVVAIGGEGGGGVHAENETYDPATDTWQGFAAMPTPRHGIQAAVLDGGVWLAGGATLSPFGPTGAHDVFFAPWPAPAARVAAPRLSSLSITPRAFRAGHHARVRYRLTGPARVRFHIDRRTGRGHRRLAGAFTRNGRRGGNAFTFRRRTLQPGRYRLGARVTGTRRVVRVSFRISSHRR